MAHGSFDVTARQSTRVAFPRRGLCLVVAGPSGCGKTTLMARLRDLEPDLRQSVSVTTRLPRQGEVDGVHYHFATMERYEELVASGGMLEHAIVHGNGYGIPRSQVIDGMEAGTDLIFVIDWQGYATMLETLPGDVVGVFLMPPSMDELRRRLGGRADSENRLGEAAVEIGKRGMFHHTVVNDNLDRAVAEVRAVLNSARVGREHDRLVPTRPSRGPVGI